jgi:hypothetical protein
MKYNATCDVVVSADAKGLIEYWSPNSLEFPSHWYFPFHNQITFNIAQSCLKLVSLMFKNLVKCSILSDAKYTLLLMESRSSEPKLSAI